MAALIFIGGYVLITRTMSVTRSDAASSASPTRTSSSLLLTVPVAGVARTQLVDSWGDAREAGLRAHAAIDIAAPAGTPVVAAITGKVEKLFVSKAGGVTAYVRSADGQWLTYYAHLQRYVDGLAEGQPIVRGDRLAYVGDTGNAGVGNTHLHFAIHKMKPGERWYQGTPVNPYPLLADGSSTR